LRLLVVDDNSDAADTLGLLLGLWGHEVRVARNGPEALEAAPAFCPDVALVDIGLPGMDGYTLAGHLRQHPVLAEVVLIAVTGLADQAHRRRSKEEGFYLHLVKPVEPEELQTILINLAQEKVRKRLRIATGAGTGS
jgi:two-component system CheB/CheR fusion protein